MSFPFDFRDIPDENFKKLLKAIEEYPVIEEQMRLLCIGCGYITPHVTKKVEASLIFPRHSSAQCQICGGAIISKYDPVDDDPFLN